MGRLLVFLLLPFSWLYAGVLAVRNWLYDAGWKKSEAFAVPLLGVGNLRVGGTGKTPHVIWLVEELLRQGHRPAILSRGYGRQTTGPRLAGLQDSAATVGDEPWQYFEHFAPQNVPVAAAEKRGLGVRLLLQMHPDTSIIVLDDAYQHRAVRPTLNVLLTEYARPFYEDQVLPAGRLRESRGGARRADVVIVTKCPPDLSAALQGTVQQGIVCYGRPNVPVLFSKYEYGTPQPFAKTLKLKEGEVLPASPPTPPVGAALLLTGIAQPQPLREYIEGQGYTVRYHARLPDHHAFQQKDLEALRAHWQPGWPIFTTEKDATRLHAAALQPALAGLPIYTIPVRVAFLGTGAAELRQLLPGAPAVASSI
ncbi:tetraacyldisaccharide 4'-kinase [Hymenobacter monticola]|uniref:Tetraacyldisaccharide 4'-kinase n=1 Tax=Hymenobacter monticola TaxID=1705399 RepID=A0ABY4B362_9BACT|nr:tetraacyldisaccharide 4'-kinase [Hymenobacter monticola]UOE33224.1 tetraacyldisaccharide 4'-kinase [Hymenobacter monticola]